MLKRRDPLGDGFAQPLNRHRRHTRIFEKDRKTRLMSMSFACVSHSLDPRAAIAFSSWRVGGIALLFVCFFKKKRFFFLKKVFFF